MLVTIVKHPVIQVAMNLLYLKLKHNNQTMKIMKHMNLLNIWILTLKTYAIKILNKANTEIIKLYFFKLPN